MPFVATQEPCFLVPASVYILSLASASRRVTAGLTWVEMFVDAVEMIPFATVL